VVNEEVQKFPVEQSAHHQGVARIIPLPFLIQKEQAVTSEGYWTENGALVE
jgi:hypothetical protein